MHKKENSAWRNTMIKKLGSDEAVTEWLRKNGAKGGKSSNKGGFYKKPELARLAGEKGKRTQRANKKLIAV